MYLKPLYVKNFGVTYSVIQLFGWNLLWVVETTKRAKYLAFRMRSKKSCVVKSKGNILCRWSDKIVCGK